MAEALLILIGLEAMVGATILIGADMYARRRSEKKNNC